MQSDIIKSIDHNHVPDVAKIEAKKTINLIKEYATTITTTRAILGETSAQRSRKTVEASPANPQSYNFEIPNKFQITLDSEQFLLFDSGDN
ncbi:FLYWCH-type zinc finger-containing protein 1, partial [Aphis craccivora]